MKKKLIVLLTAALLVFSLCASALATSVYFSGNVNVRTGPGVGYATMGSVNAGSTLTWLGGTQYDNRGVAWYSVSFGGRTGWVSSTYSSLTGYSGEATYGSGANGSNYYDNYGGYNGGYNGGYSGYGSYVYGSSGNSNVRTGPGLGYSSIGTLYSGQSATYLNDVSYDSRGVAWYKISFNGRTGWVSSRYTSVY